MKWRWRPIISRKIILLTLLIVLLLGLIELTSMNTHYGGGNGNLALVFIIPLIPLLGWFAVTLFRLSAALHLGMKAKAGLLICTIIIATLAILYQNGRYDQIRENVRLGMIKRNIPLDEAHIESITSGLTAYTNTLYFGYVNFVLLLAIIVTAGVWFSKRADR
ncbi:hypothetical protein PAECIP111893_04209 [Paenibacillus plantiphilus]|uniref:DUF4199 domain-containing protein n=1 Tax=Paenibacillus plantiphilus TaxID=2905650 RepID=A0ABM9CMU1_9BACL|nr:hypothetical protein [Paenibacillus plantiphilus]CAH1216937.1 hypothetical protein PAECIP111893_04209 [Paenibacillus plantiphilus]